MTVDHTNEEINKAYVGQECQARLFYPHPRKVCNEIRLNWLTALSLRDKGWLSFDPEAIIKLEEQDEAELRFVGSLVAWGFDESQLDMLLKDLRKPYRYRIERMYFDWLARKWWLLPCSPDLDTIQDVIDTLQQEGEVDVLRSLYEQISEALDINQVNYRKRIIDGIANRECKKIVSNIICLFQQLTEGMQSGDDTPLNNLWDEICVQVQGEESVFWGAYLEDISLAIKREVGDLDTEIQQAIWLQTDIGIDWEIDNEGDDMATFCIDDIVDYVQYNVLSAADDWTNEEIEKYLTKEYDDPNIG